MNLSSNIFYFLHLSSSTSESGTRKALKLLFTVGELSVEISHLDYQFWVIKKCATLFANGACPSEKGRRRQKEVYNSSYKSNIIKNMK